MSWDKIQFFIALLSLICLILSYYYASKKEKISNLDKGVLTFFSIVILALSDRFKLLIWCAVVGIVWLITHYKKSKKNEST